jgi:predicted transcriptional regulator
VTAAWVQERLGGDLTYTTVVTILTRLLAKDAVARERQGRSFIWTPTADVAGLAGLKMRRLLDGERDREAVLAGFVTALPPGDEQVLRALLEAAQGAGRRSGRRLGRALRPGERRRDPAEGVRPADRLGPGRSCFHHGARGQ